MEKIANAQTRSSGNWRQNSEKAEHFMKKAKAEQAKMIIFPEYFMNYYPDADHKYIESPDALWRFCNKDERSCERIQDLDHFWDE